MEGENCALRTFCAEPEGLRGVGRKERQSTRAFLAGMLFGLVALKGESCYERTSRRKGLIRLRCVGYGREGSQGALAVGLVPPTRIERATRGLGNRSGQFLECSVYQMVSPF